MPKRQTGNKKNKQSNFAKLSIFQPNKYKFKKNCPLSVKGAPKIDYKNIKLLKRYVSENGKILPSRITNISQKKQRELSFFSLSSFFEKKFVSRSNSFTLTVRYLNNFLSNASFFSSSLITLPLPLILK